jgi:ubiquinone/menaquinone biosynthesis C-methylase UbiE
MERIGKEISSKPLWEELSKSYVDALDTPYHKHRMEVIFKLLPGSMFTPGQKLLDFGCGDAVLFPFFLSKGVEIFGIDIAETIIELGRQRLAASNFDPEVLKRGDISSLQAIESNSLDGVLCFNTLAYFTDEEEIIFYKEVNRILKKGGYLAVSHSNELFDLYTLNRFTVEFFSRNFLKDKTLAHEIAGLLKFPGEPEVYTTYNVRENPLAYKDKLFRYGFEETNQLFSNLYELPPLALNLNKADATFDFKQKEYPSTLETAKEEQWKLMFTCSTYMSLSQKL